MSIPLAKLFGRGQGALAVLPGDYNPKDKTDSSMLATVISFVSRDQTAFDTFFAVPPTYERMLRAYSPYEDEDLSDLGTVMKMTWAVCEIGINQETSMQLKRLAAAAPRPRRAYLGRVRMHHVTRMLVVLIDLHVIEYGLNAYTRSRAVMCVDMDLCDMWEGINGFGM